MTMEKRETIDWMKVAVDYKYDRLAVPQFEQLADDSVGFFEVPVHAAPSALAMAARAAVRLAGVSLNISLFQASMAMS